MLTADMQFQTVDTFKLWILGLLGRVGSWKVSHLQVGDLLPSRPGCGIPYGSDDSSAS